VKKVYKIKTMSGNEVTRTDVYADMKDFLKTLGSIIALRSGYVSQNEKNKSEFKISMEWE